MALADFNKWIADGPYGLVNQKMLTNADRVRQVEDNFLTEADQRDYENTWGH